MQETVYKKIEEACVSASGEITGTEVHACNIYVGRTKTPLAISMARALAFVFMHDVYAVNYRKIAERSSMSVRAVMRCAAKARELRFIDPVYRKCYELIENRL